MYTYKIWDEKTPVNGVSPELVFKDFPRNSWGRVYLIMLDGEVTQIYRESLCPYQGETFEDSARLHCEALNAEETTQNESEEQQNG